PESLACLRIRARLRRDLLEVRVFRDFGGNANARHDIAHDLLGLVAQSVRTVGPNRKVYDLALFELSFTLGTAQRRPSPEHDQELFGAVVKVVDDGVPRTELVQARSEERTAVDEPFAL